MDHDLYKSVDKCFKSLFALGWLAAFMAMPQAHSIPPPGPSHAAHLLKHHLQGRVVGDRYYSYGSSFSILLPSTSDATQIEDSYAAPNIGGVAFFNEAGFLLKLEIEEIVPEASTLVAQHPEIKDEMLEALFNDALLLQIRATVPKTEVLTQKMVKMADGQPALFAVLDLPGAATLIDMTTGASLDSKRGYLVFLTKNNDLVCLSLQDTLSFIPSIASAAKASLNERLLHHLLQYQSTIEFTVRGKK